MRLLVSIDIPAWLHRRIGNFLNLRLNDLEFEELLDCAFKRKLDPESDILAVEELLCERISYAAKNHDCEVMSEMYRIVDELIRAITIDPMHRRSLSGHSEFNYNVSGFYDDTFIVTLHDVDGDHHESCNASPPNRGIDTAFLPTVYQSGQS